MKRIKPLTRVNVAEAYVQQGPVLTLLEKQLRNAMADLAGKGPKAAS